MGRCLKGLMLLRENSVRTWITGDYICNYTYESKVERNLMSGGTATLLDTASALFTLPSCFTQHD
jgi:hypothetical protein